MIRRWAWIAVVLAAFFWLSAWRRNGQLEGRIAEAKRAIAQLEPPRPAPVAPTETAAPPPSKPVKRRKEASGLQAADMFLSDPKLRQSYFAAREAEIDAVYGPFFRKLGLGPPQVARLEALLLERDRRVVEQAAASDQAAEAMQPVWRNGAPRPDLFLEGRLEFWVQSAARRGADGGLATVLNETNPIIQNAISQSAGEDGWAQFQEFQASLNLARLTANLGGALSAGPEPLTAQQAQELTAILQPMAAKGADIYSLLSWHQVLDQTGTILTPGQQQMFERMNTEQIARADFMRMIAELQLGNSDTPH